MLYRRLPFRLGASDNDEQPVAAPAPAPAQRPRAELAPAEPVSESPAYGGGD